MKRTVCLLTALCCLLMPTGCEKASGEETLPPANETTQPTQITTAPPETTVPKATTAPLVTEDIPYLRVFDTISKADMEAAGTVIHFPQLDPSGLVSAIHASFSTAMGYELPYQDGVFWECTDEQEYKSGSHFQCYALDNGQLVKLENRTLPETLSVEGWEIPVDMQYTIYQDRFIVTYMRNSGSITILDDSLGAKDCLVRLDYLDQETDGYFNCLAFMDMETGTVKSSFYMPERINFDYNFIAVTKEGGIIIQNRGNEQYWLLNASTGFFVGNYSYNPRETALSHNTIYRDGQDYLEVTDPLDEETILLKIPEGWEDEDNWWLSPDGRKLMAWGYHDILIYDGDRNMWIDIQRELTDGISEDLWYWTKDSEIVLASEDRTHISVYRIAPE